MGDELAFDLTSTYVHLGLGAKAVPLPGFSWSREFMVDYLTAFRDDRDEGRLVGIVPLKKDWTHWECHNGGDEVVVMLSGRCEMIQQVDGAERSVELGPGEAIINPRGVWHTSNVREPGQSLFIAAGRRTGYRPR
jgi:mannose-6-phosphate isomerase-like protein (cupin superfamily)